MRIRTDIRPGDILRARGLGEDHGARLRLATTVKRLSDPYVPMSAGSGAHMKNLAQVAEDGSHILYRGPYAHYQYRGEVMAGRAPKHYTGKPIDYHGGPMRGPNWDKRMLADRRREIVADLANYVGGKPK